MDQFEIIGGRPLKGTVPISGSKNAALPCLFATLLTDETCVLKRVPTLADIHTSVKLLETLGKRVTWKNGTVTVTRGGPMTGLAPYELVRRMRASILVMGPLLARMGKAHVSLPGGCAIGARPVDYHLEAFRKMGVQIKIAEGYVDAHALELQGRKIKFPYASVGATENVMMGAVLARGTTILENAAREPEIVNLGDMLVRMGGKISGLGTSRIVIQGVEQLRGMTHDVIPDRIETGTWLIAAAITGGDLKLKGVDLNALGEVVKTLKKAGVIVQKVGKFDVRVRAPKALKHVSVRTEVYPGFPTDMQAQWLSLMSVTPGRSQIKETVFENRFLHVQELVRFGADIRVSGRRATITGVPYLSGCSVMASDLRAGAALVLAGLAARGKTTLQRVYHIDRGYEEMEKKLKRVGALIRRVNPAKRGK